MGKPRAIYLPRHASTKKNKKRDTQNSNLLATWLEDQHSVLWIKKFTVYTSQQFMSVVSIDIVFEYILK